MKHNLLNRLPLLIVFYVFIGLFSWFAFFKPSYATPVVKTPPRADLGLIEASQLPDICGLTVVECESENPVKAIEKAAKKYDVDEKVMLALAKCESQMGKMMVGDHGQSYGLFQIHLGYHPEITKEQAMDFEWSAEWTAKQIKAGRINLWSCAKKI